MQALAERLNSIAASKSLAEIVALQFSALKTYDPAPESLLGVPVSEVGRRGKYLVFSFSGPRLLVHLSQGGRLDVEDPPKATRPKAGVVRFRFEGGPSLLVKEFGTQRKAGWWVLSEGDDGPLERLGPEPDDPAFARWIREGSDGRRLHTALRDQRTVAGIGRGFVDDILHEARLSPYMTLTMLDDEGRARLLRAVSDVLERALERERDRTGGYSDKLPDRFSVHGRTGGDCPRCGDELLRVSYEGYEITYCPACQTGGKRLADRRLSRLVK